MKLRKGIDKALEFFLILIVAVLVADVLWQVVSRYILKSPSSFTDELARFLLIWVGILGSAYATGKKLHLAIDVIVNKFNEKNRALINNLINIAVSIFALTVMVIGGTNLIYILLKLGNTSAALLVPIGYVYAVIPISGLLIIYYSLFDLIIGMKSNNTKKYLD
ncbi:MAG: TRAP transporter small permease [Melioribacteraceae bacterium]|nr:TRAP transporter small permease [Melioribacteraceae bacterium]